MNKKGFTLVELMIVIAIIGVVAAFAYPSYEAYVVRSKRTDGMAALMNAMNAMERYRATNMSYVGAAADVTFESSVPADGGTPYYDISLSNVGATTYTLTATPQNSMAGKDGPLTITQAGIKTWTDENGSTQNCWPESSSSC
jgi:type IV pilus assembly protein PilE